MARNLMSDGEWAFFEGFIRAVPALDARRAVGGRPGWLEPRGAGARQASDDRQHCEPRPSSRGGRKRGTPKEALGRSKGGFAVYTLPFMLGVAAAKWAYASGSGLIDAGLVAGGAVYGLLVFAFTSLRSPILRLIVALVFAAPAAVAGYALVHGVTGGAVTSEIWPQIFCIIGGGFVGMSALMRLPPPMATTEGSRSRQPFG